MNALPQELTRYTLHHGDCLEVMATLPAGSVDAVVTDPPYGLKFMGRSWDHGIPGEPFWREALRVAKPGCHLLAFGGTRTFHRLMCAIEDSGWEIRDTLMWVYGSGFPKSMDVSKAIDKEAGAERDVLYRKPWKPGPQLSRDGHSKQKYRPSGDPYPSESNGFTYSAPKTDLAIKWSGFGTALKPAWEPIILARKPLAGTVAANVLEYGTGALNIDGCRVEPNGDNLNGGRVSTKTDGWDRPWKHNASAVDACRKRGKDAVEKAESLGRWPANLLHDGSEEVTELFPVTQSQQRTGKRTGILGAFTGQAETTIGHADSGYAARFFYCAKASRADRDEGCEEIPEVLTMRYGEKAQGPLQKQTPSKPVPQRNHHPTVKPTDLMRYLCRLVTPPGGMVLDPFMGSGSTGKAALLEGFGFLGIEREPEYLEIARARLEKAAHEMPLLRGCE